MGIRQGHVVPVIGLICALSADVLAVPAATVPIVDSDVAAGVGTSLSNVFGDATNVPVRTSVTSVSYEPPRLVQDRGVQYFELTGTVQGIGWGGEYQQLDGPYPILDAGVHYAYDIPFVLRWHREWDGTLVYYSHGRTELALLSLIDRVIGANNEGRRNEEEGRFISDAMISGDRRHAFFAPNVSGLGRIGQLTMIGIDAPFSSQPLAGTVDAVTARDLAAVAKRLLAKFAGKSPARTIGAGHSAGALIMQFLSGGVSLFMDEQFPKRMFTGGAYNTPYVPGSGQLFDAVVPIAPADLRVNPAFPSTAPMLMIAGQAEFAGLSAVLHAFRMKQNGVVLNNRLRIYQVRNLPHNFAEIVEATPNMNAFAAQVFGSAPRADGDRLAPVVAAVLDAALAWVARGALPPASRIEGRGIDTGGDPAPDAIGIPMADGTLTTMVPSVDDASLDSIGFLFDTASDPVVVSRYVDVLGALAHEASALALPSLRCRRGGYVISEQFSDSTLVPFADMSAHWKNDGLFAACVAKAEAELAKTGLYDAKIAR